MKQERPHWREKGCADTYTREEAKPVIRRLYTSTRRLTITRRRVARRYVVCQRRPVSRRLMARYRRTWSRWRRSHRGLLRERRLWAWYRAHPMPRCTWVGESGGDYRAKNPTSTAGGKYQIIDRTWYANGGSVYRVRHPAAAAPPLEQEKVARNVLRSQGLGAWVNC